MIPSEFAKQSEEYLAKVFIKDKRPFISITNKKQVVEYNYSVYGLVNGWLTKEFIYNKRGTVVEWRFNITKEGKKYLKGVNKK